MRIMSEIVDPEGWLAPLPRRIDWSMNSYTHPKWLKVPPFDDNVEGSDVLNPVENVSSVLVDAVVDWNDGRTLASFLQTARPRVVEWEDA